LTILAAIVLISCTYFNSYFSLLWISSNKNL